MCYETLILLEVNVAAMKICELNWRDGERVIELKDSAKEKLINYWMSRSYYETLILLEVNEAAMKVCELNYREGERVIELKFQQEKDS